MHVPTFEAPDRKNKQHVSLLTFPTNSSRLLASLLSGLVPEPEDEGQTAETLPAVAAPPRRPPGGAPDEPCRYHVRPTVPLHPAPPPAPPPTPPLSTGSPLAGLLPTSRSLRSAHEDPGRHPPLPLPRQSGRAVPGHGGGSVPFHRRRAPPCLVSLSALPSLGIRTAAQSQRGTAGTEPTVESQRQNPTCGTGAAGRDGVTSERHCLNPVKLLAIRAALRKMTHDHDDFKLYQRSGQNAKYTSQLTTSQTCKTFIAEASLQFSFETPNLNANKCLDQTICHVFKACASFYCTNYRYASVTLGGQPLSNSHSK